MPRPKRSYDHRLRETVQRTGDLRIATSHGVPRSTAAGWLKAECRPTVTVDALSMKEEDLQSEVMRLRRRVMKLRAVIAILVAVLKVLQVDLGRRRVPDGESKSILLRAIQRATGSMKLRTALAAIGLSPARYHSWRRAERGCDLDDHTSCPKITPHRLTSTEIQAMREMVTSTDYRHVPTGTLAVLAQRMGRVFASATTWHRFVREHGWRRPGSVAPGQAQGRHPCRETGRDLAHRHIDHPPR